MAICPFSYVVLPGKVEESQVKKWGGAVSMLGRCTLIEVLSCVYQTPLLSNKRSNVCEILSYLMLKQIVAASVVRRDELSQPSPQCILSTRKIHVLVYFISPFAKTIQDGFRRQWPSTVSLGLSGGIMETGRGGEGQRR